MRRRQPRSTPSPYTTLFRSPSPSTTGQVTVRDPSLFLYGVATTRTTASTPDNVYAYLYCGYGYGCGVLNADLAVTFSAVDTTGSPSSIVNVSTPNNSSATSV